MSLESEIINTFALDFKKISLFYTILEYLNEEWTSQVLLLVQHCLENALADFVWDVLCLVASSSRS